ncbi:MAG: hypothetical protein FWE21_05620 [Defluviitaleaceae bacterium]|nr:hypothetical protein [Defluviitaleaceae bacterium]
MQVSGAQSGDDKVTYAPTRDELNCRLDAVKNSLTDDGILDVFGKFTRDQSAEKIRNDVLSPEGIIVGIEYRPFDKLWTYYTGISGGWGTMPREKRLSDI